MFVYTVGVSLHVRSSCCFQMCVQPCCPEFVFKCFAPPFPPPRPGFGKLCPRCVLNMFGQLFCQTCLRSTRGVQLVSFTFVIFDSYLSSPFFYLTCLSTFILLTGTGDVRLTPRKDILTKTDCRILIRILRCIPRTKMEFQQCICI